MTRVLGFALFGLLGLSPAPAQPEAPKDPVLQASIQQALGDPYLSHVHVAVQQGVVTLSGTVDLYITKLLAEKKALAIRHGNPAKTIRNRIEVMGPSVPDPQLKARLEDALHHRSAISEADSPRWLGVHVKNGVVTLDGHASATTLAAVTGDIGKIPGVKDLVLDVQVYPNNMHGEEVEWPSAAGGTNGLSSQ